jgi:hypothetical protein
VRRASYLAVLVTIAAAAMALAGASAAAGPASERPAATVATPAAASVAAVRQIGPRNYAGPNCPGRGWRCTTSLNVVQVATADGQNVAECSGPGLTAGPGSAANASCTFVQTGNSNTARCTQRSTSPGAIQACDITQTGANNKAYVAQTIKSSGADQDGQQRASVTQGPGAGANASNEVHISQKATQSTKSGPAAQDAWQSAVVTQSAKGTGKNASDIRQSQSQKASNGATQSQNSTFTPPAGFVDCDPGFPSAPNACANVSQDSELGKNQNTLRQTITQQAKSKVIADQDQGEANGGLEGRVHQETDSGSSQNTARQRKQQRMSAAAGSSQFQHDPVRCCGTFSQIGGDGNKENIDQGASLKASEPEANQEIDLTGESRSPDGSCTVTQKASTNSASTPNSASFNPCPFLILSTTCIDGVVSEGPGSCFAAPPQTSDID